MGGSFGKGTQLLPEKVLFDRVVGQHQGLLVGQAGLVCATQAGKKFGPRRGQIWIPREWWFGPQPVEGVESRLRALGVSDRDRAVEGDDGGRPDRDEPVVQAAQLPPAR